MSLFEIFQRKKKNLSLNAQVRTGIPLRKWVSLKSNCLLVDKMVQLRFEFGVNVVSIGECLWGTNGGGGGGGSSVRGQESIDLFCI